MTAQEAMRILDAMADGLDPKSGKVLPPTSVVNQRNVIRALQMALEAMKNQHHSLKNNIKSKATQRKTPILLVKSKTQQTKPNPQPSLSDFLHLLEDSKMFEYLQAFKKKGITPTVSRLGRCLVGSQAKSVYQLVKDFPFYGILDGIATYSYVKSYVNSFFEKNSERIERDFLSQNKPWEEIDFFEKIIFNNLSPIIIKRLSSAILEIPIKRKTTDITSELIVIARQIHPRAYEPWLQKENDLLLRTMRYTNNLKILSNIFQRGPGAIRSQGQKLLHHIEIAMKGKRTREAK